jgi:predicted metalloprotease with PDZ domain
MRHTVRLTRLACTLALAVTAAPLQAQNTTPHARGWLGFSFQIREESRTSTPGANAPQEPQQVVVGEVLKGSPADHAGLEPGDTLVRIDGENATARRVSDMAARLRPGDTVRVSVRRAGRTQALTMVAAERPAYLGDVRVYPRGNAGERQYGTWVFPNGDSIRRMVRIYIDSARVALDSMPLPRVLERRDSTVIFGWGNRMDTIRLPRLDGRTLLPLMRWDSAPGHALFLGENGPAGFEFGVVSRNAIAGAALQELNPQLAEYFGVRQGLLVERVSSGTPAARAGLRAGDVVTGAAGLDVGDVADLRRAMRGREGSVELDVLRKGQRQTLTLKWP